MIDVRQGSRLQRWVLDLVCRMTGWNYFWYFDESAGRRRLWLGNPHRPIR